MQMALIKEIYKAADRPKNHSQVSQSRNKAKYTATQKKIQTFQKQVRYTTSDS